GKGTSNDKPTLDGPRTTPSVTNGDRLAAGNLEARCGLATDSRPRRSPPSSASGTEPTAHTTARTAAPPRSCSRCTTWSGSSPADDRRRETGCEPSQHGGVCLGAVRGSPQTISTAAFTCGLPVVWLRSPGRTVWAVLHTIRRHSGRVEAIVVIELDVPRAWQQ